MNSKSYNYHYLSLVRNINDNVMTPKNIETLRKHIDKSKIKHGFLYTREISNAHEQLHIHGILTFETIQDRINMEKYIETHRLKAYIDKVISIPAHEVRFYAKYMFKDYEPSWKKYEDYMYKDHINNEGYFAALLDGIGMSNIVEDIDPFIDSDTEITINKCLNCVDFVKNNI